MTVQVGVQSFYFNAKANIFVLTAINFRLRETGAWQVRDDLWTIPVNLYGPGGSAAAADITVLVIFVMFVCGEAWQFRHAYQAGSRGVALSPKPNRSPCFPTSLS